MQEPPHQSPYIVTNSLQCTTRCNIQCPYIVTLPPSSSPTIALNLAAPAAPLGSKKGAQTLPRKGLQPFQNLASSFHWEELEKGFKEGFPLAARSWIGVQSIHKNWLLPLATMNFQTMICCPATDLDVMCVDIGDIVAASRALHDRLSSEVEKGLILASK